MSTDLYPRYAEMLGRTDAPAASAGGIFGDDDEIGKPNFITAETIMRASSLVVRGAFFNLDVALNGVLPTKTGGRKLAEHHIAGRLGPERDDWLDSFYLQQSSQIDGLRHRGHPEHGFCNATPADFIDVAMPALGILRWVERGIVGRWLLLDLERALADDGVTFSVDGNEPISVPMLERTIERQHSPIEPGDILLLRTGCGAVPEFGRGRARAGPRASDQPRPRAVRGRGGLALRISMIAADNPAREAYPTVADAPFPWTHPLLHPILIGLLGMALGSCGTSNSWRRTARTTGCTHRCSPTSR